MTDLVSEGLGESWESQIAVGSRKEIGTTSEGVGQGQQSQKRKMVCSSLSFTRIINVEFNVSLVVSGQRPRSGRCPLPQRKWATEAV